MEQPRIAEQEVVKNEASPLSISELGARAVSGNNAFSLPIELSRPVPRDVDALLSWQAMHYAPKPTQKHSSLKKAAQQETQKVSAIAAKYRPSALSTPFETMNALVSGVG